MHRLIVVLLAAIDAAIAAAVALAAILATLTLVWIFGIGGAADWATLWPVGATIWQFAHFAPVAISLPAEYLAATGIDPSVAEFTMSLAPFALAAFTAIFAVRSGRRASHAGAWVTGVVTGAVLFAAIATVVGVTGAVPVARVELWQAILFPSLVYALPALAGAIVTEWREAGDGVIARVRDRGEALPDGWGAVPALVARGSAVVVIGLIGLGALGTGVALVLGAGDIVALFESSHVDAFGASVMTLGQFVYLPTVIVWAMSFIAGPGFALGAQTSVSPAGTQVGVLPGIPVLGAVPESTTPWLLLLALLPVALGAFAGWIARSRLVGAGVVRPIRPTRSAIPVDAPAAEMSPARSAALSGMLATTEADRAVALEDTVDLSPLAIPADPGHDPVGARLVIALGIAACSAIAVGLLALFASGSFGPGTLAEMGPQPGPVALVVGLEIVVGASILLLAPRRRDRSAEDSAIPRSTEAQETAQAIRTPPVD